MLLDSVEILPSFISHLVQQHIHFILGTQQANSNFKKRPLEMKQLNKNAVILHA